MRWWSIRTGSTICPGSAISPPSALVFMTVVAVNRVLRQRGFWTDARPEPDLLALLDLVALGTVADVVPLNGLNRAFVAKGLIALRRRDNVGLTALMDVARLAGPPEPASRLPARPAHQRRRPHRPRRSRRAAAAGGGLRSRPGASPPNSIGSTASGRCSSSTCWRKRRPRRWLRLGSRRRARWWSPPPPNWHPGVVGLIAARLKERFDRPAFAIALEPGGIGTGSGRSIAGVDLGSAVRQAVAEGLLLKGGGHAMAAGITVARERLAAFRAYLESALAAAVDAARADHSLLIDGAVSAAAPMSADPRRRAPVRSARAIRSR